MLLVDAFHWRQLGYGAFATVFIGKHKATGNEYAVKKVDRSKMLWGDRDALKDEISNLKAVKDGPHIVKLYEEYSDKHDCYLVMELMQGGELFDRIIQKRTFTEKEARDVCRCMLEALQYMHSKRVVHRDLKPENLLLPVSPSVCLPLALIQFQLHTADSSMKGSCLGALPVDDIDTHKKSTPSETDVSLTIFSFLPTLVFPLVQSLIPFRWLQTKHNDTDIKLADFGFAKEIGSHNGCRTLCGTPGYLAPEILERWPAYDTKCDLWSVGVILFLLLGGYLPFEDDDEDKVFDRTRNGQYEFHPSYFRNVSRDAKEMVTVLLTINPSKRANAKVALEHTWMQCGDQALESQELDVDKLRDSMSAKTKIKAAVNALVAANRLKELNDGFNKYLQKRRNEDAHLSIHPAMSRMPGKSIVMKDDSESGKPFADFYKVGELVSRLWPRLALGASLLSFSIPSGYAEAFRSCHGCCCTCCSCSC